MKFKNTNRFQLIREMFIYGNRLPAPGEIIRKSILKQIGFFNPALLQTQDYDFHVRTLLKNKIYIYQKPLVKYRQMINGSQIDNHSNLSILRQNLELPFVLDNFLKMDINLFIKVFSQDFKVFGKPTRETIPYFLGKIALKTDDQIRQKWGYETILNFIKDTKNLKLLNSLYSIQYKDIISLVNKINFDSKSQKINYKDTKFRKIIRKFLNKEK
ncbi:hypothetical protein GYA19_05415 [Candidatus Beckwithbacteria bacterium]|nr:hypothetical protein [Candidatus Beckwithbacteria bacterium]